MSVTKKATFVVFAEGEVGLQIIRVMLKHDLKYRLWRRYPPQLRKLSEIVQEYRSIRCKDKRQCRLMALDEGGT
jgi:hypothetical protein